MIRPAIDRDDAEGAKGDAERPGLEQRRLGDDVRQPADRSHDDDGIDEASEVVGDDQTRSVVAG